MAQKLQHSKFVWLPALALLFLLPACSLNVKKGDNGEDKKVDIQTPLGGIHVDKEADVRDVGLPVYPGARQKPKGDHDESSANVNMSWGPFGLKVVAIEYLTDDSPEKVIAFYKDKLKTYGNILECHSDKRDADDVDVELGKDKGSKELNCGNNQGKNLELKVGTKDNQHMVSIHPQDSGKGTDFALVYIRTRNDKDKDTI